MTIVKNLCLSNVNSLWFRVRVIVFNATLNNISDISMRSVQLVEETTFPEETTELMQVKKKNTDLSQVIDKLYHIMLYRIYIPLHERDSNSQL